MLDSTGYHSTQKVLCFLCAGNDLEFPTYTPTQDHGGNDLKNYGTCIKSNRTIAAEDPNFKNWGSMHLFTVRPFSERAEDQCGCDPDCCNENQLFFEPYKVHVSLKPYHYLGLVLPDFGDSVGQVIYICASCFKAKSKETALCAKGSTKCLKGSALREALVAKFHKLAEGNLGEALTMLLLHNLVGFSPRTLKGKFRRLPPGVRDYVERCLSWSRKNLPAFGDNRNARRAARKIKPLIQVILPPSK